MRTLDEVGTTQSEPAGAKHAIVENRLRTIMEAVKVFCWSEYVGLCHLKCITSSRHPPRSPNSRDQSSNCFSPSLLTEGLIVCKLAWKS